MFIKIKRLFSNESRNNFSKYLNIDGWLTESEANGLFKIASLIGPNSTVLEIGSWKGKSTWCIAQGLQKGTIHCIDPFNAAGESGSKEMYEEKKGEKSLLEQFKQNMEKAPKSIHINIHQGYSQEFVGLVKNIDFLFIDGDHSIEGCKFDFEHFEKDLNKGGYVAFHDYYPDRNDLGPTWVVDQLLKNNTNYLHHGNYDSLCVYQKIN